MTDFVVNIYSEFKRTIKQTQCISEDTLLIAAISGGADSTAMFDLLVRLRNTDISYNLFATHFDHQLRPESSNEAQIVQNQCNLLGVELFIGSGDIAAESARQRRSEHDIARELRYKFFAQTALNLKEDLSSDKMPIIVTAHHFDDQVETVLMRLFRGSGLSGLSGIRSSFEWSEQPKVKVIRPLLEFRHEQLKEYCQRLQLEFVIDPSNADVNYPRNKVRHEIIPVIVDKIGSVALHGIVRSAEIIRGADEFSSSEINQMLEESVLNRRSCELELDYKQYKSYLKWIRLECIKRIACSIAEKSLRITYERCVAVEQFLRYKQGGVVEIGGGISVTCKGDRIFFFKKPATVDGKRLVVPGIYDLRDWGRLQLNVVDVDRVKLPPRPGSLFLNWSATYGSCLELAPVSDGDRISPLGMKGRRKVSDYLADSGVPVYRRHYPAIWIGKDIAAIPPFGISDLFMISGSSVRALEIIWSDV